MPEQQNLEQKKAIEEWDERPPIRLIKEIEAEHPDEWIKIEVTRMAEDKFTPLEGRLVAHGKDYNEVSQRALVYFKKHDTQITYGNYLGDMKVEAVLL